MDQEPLDRKAFLAFLRRLEQGPVDFLLIEIAREIERTKRGKQATLRSDRESLLQEVRAEIVEVLCQILREGKGNAFLRMEAAEILGGFEIVAGKAVPALVGALSDEVSFVRVTACQALGRIGAAARPAIEPLRQRADDEDPEVRRAAAEAMETISRP